jgi:sarcosine oxidase
MERIEHVVIGAGAMGSAAAWSLARRGRSVLLLEQFERGHTRGSSHGGTRIFRFAYDDPRYVRLAMEALPLWRELEDDAGRVLLDLVGSLDHGPAARIDAVAAALTRNGARFERWSADEARERYPGMRFEESVLFSPDGGRSRAADTLSALADRTAAHGGRVIFQAGRASVEADGDGAVVRCEAGEWRADSVVVAAGAWLASVVGWSVPLPPLAITQEQVLHFPPGDPAVDEWPSFIHHQSPWRYGLFTPGEGVKVGGHHEGGTTTADDRSGEIDPAAAARIVEYVERWLPGLEPAPRFGATCLYTTTPSEDFLIDRIGPLVVGSACSGHGFKFTPLIGRLLADVAVGGEPPGEPFLGFSS